MSAKLYRGIKFRPEIKLTMEKDTFIGDNCVILVPALVMRRGSQINAGTIISGRREVVLGENVVVGYHCLLLTSTDRPSGEYMNDASPEERRNIISDRIEICANAFVASNSLIMPGVHIAKGIVVRAFSYVGKDLKSENMIYKDNHCIRSRGDIRRTNI